MDNKICLLVVWMTAALSACTALLKKALFPPSLQVLANVDPPDFKHLWSSGRLLWVDEKRAKQVSPGRFGSGSGRAAEVPPRPA